MDAVETRRRIVDLLDLWDEEHETSGCPAKAGECIHSASTAVRAAVDLHAPSSRRGSEDICAGCEIRGVGFVRLDHCKTLAVVAAALGLWVCACSRTTSQGDLITDDASVRMVPNAAAG